MSTIRILWATALAFVSVGIVGSAQAEANEPAKTATQKSADEQIRCRKVEVTGSLVKKGKVCRTIAEWRKIQQNGNDTARTMLGEQICTGGECRGN